MELAAILTTSCQYGPGIIFGSLVGLADTIVHEDCKNVRRVPKALDPRRVLKRDKLESPFEMRFWDLLSCCVGNYMLNFDRILKHLSANLAEFLSSVGLNSLPDRIYIDATHIDTF